MSESELISRVRSGDLTAWESIMQEQQEAVFRLAYLFLGDAGEAEDVAQEVFIRAFRYINSFDSARALRPWLFGITANLARNRRRSIGRYVYHLARMARLAPPDVIDPEQETTRRAEAALLWKAVRCLSDEDQEIIYLRYFMEFSVEETAETLSIAPGTVKSRLSRALERLRGVARKEFPMLRRTADE